ncbi:BREX-1 system adenine-specific DNA-methyltransferase PglX [uncultured Eubacterium sp.]|uniref:BREX-1 system adenine-specific DNA-methyltransferase PglX n=1 Tax=uncultured Eubacterium sp. TaxID=165185 RepID=UPI0026341487|nr:BREX-1 system adenine-specific DNA-methyltransferase PglX [uncultured Eubacterium sp.]
MDKTELKRFAVEARVQLMEQVRQKAFEYGITADSYGEENATVVGEKVLSPTETEQRAELVRQIKHKGFEQVVEEVAYTWFNRFIALRYMEVNGYLPTRVRVFSNDNNAFEPDILKEATSIELDGLDINVVYDYLDKNDNESLYKYLLITQCNALSPLLPGMFEKLSNYTELLFPNNLLRQDSVIGKMVTEISENNWTNQVQVIGWLYQYYISEKHSSVIDIKGGKAIKKEDVPAATQLFTPDWIVRYMVDNSLGRYWIERNPESNLKSKLKFYVEPENFTTVDEKILPENLTVFDPCMGSGHILVYAFEVLMQIYVECGYTERDAASLILENNLFGLDIDDRAYQLAYFAVMMKARSYDRRILTRNIKPNVYSIKESNFLVDSWYKISKDGKFKDIFKTIVDTFIDAKEYGSILNVSDTDYDYALSVIDDFEQNGTIDFEAKILLDKIDDIRALVNQAKLMAKKYTAVVTNPPYMNKFDAKLKKYITDNFADYKGDLFSVFMYHNFSFCTPNGYSAFMTPLVWMFIKTYEPLRNYILNFKHLSTLIQFEYSAFEEATVPICTFVLRNDNDINKSLCFRLSDFKGGMEVQKQKVLEALADKSCGYYYETDQTNFSKIPGSPIAYWVSQHAFDVCIESQVFEKFATTRAGMITGNNNMFIRLWHEVNWKKVGILLHSRSEAIDSKKKWFPYNKGGEYRKWYGNNDYVVNWENDGSYMRNYKDDSGKIPAHAFNLEYIFKENVTWSSLSSYKFAARYTDYGFLYDASGSFADVKTENIFFTLAFLCSEVTLFFLGVMNPTLNFQKGNISSLPFIIDTRRMDQVNNATKENVTISKADWNSYENSWNFKRNPLI